MKPTVVFLHGLGRTHRSLFKLRRRVESAGYPTWARTYPSRRLGIDELADRVAGWIESDLGPDTPIVGVTHSLGGILVRHMTEKLAWQGLVMLAPPNSGSRVARLLLDNPIFKWYFGPAGQEVAFGEDWPAPPEPFAVIAGTKNASVVNSTSWLTGPLRIFPPESPSDGTVAVAETRLPNMADFNTVEASHTWIMNHDEVASMVLNFLRHQSLRPLLLESHS